MPDDPVAFFYGDVPRPEAEEFAKRLVPQSAKSFSDALTRAGWHTVPSTYIVCEECFTLPECHMTLRRHMTHIENPSEELCCSSRPISLSNSRPGIMMPPTRNPIPTFPLNRYWYAPHIN